jgi:hypothetical protein
MVVQGFATIVLPAAILLCQPPCLGLILQLLAQGHEFLSINPWTRCHEAKKSRMLPPSSANKSAARAALAMTKAYFSP